MKLLYIIITIFVMCRTTNASHVKHTLLILPSRTEKVPDSYIPGGQSYKFTSGKSVTVDSSQTDLVGLKLKAPYIVTAIFKPSSKAFGLFDIRDTSVVLGLVITRNQIGPKVFIDTGLSEKVRYASFQFKEDFKDKWMKLVAYVQPNGTVALYKNCNKTPNINTRISTVKDGKLLSNNVQINLANYMGNYYFEGLIEEISLYTNVDDNSINQICAENKEFQSTTAVPGPPGPVGLPGLPGIKGDKGDKGSTGEYGPVGPVGQEGLPGQKGDRGDLGYSGEKGLPGLVGPEGPQGAKGDRGLPGFDGANGLNGQPGMQGEKGDKGSVGAMGEKGIIGLSGLPGSMGMPGLPGIKGDRGGPGYKGEMGERGNDGIPGTPGRDGLPASLTSLLDAENTAVVEKLRGFKGETGMSGEKGTKGDRGMQGEPGLIGLTGEPGIRGRDGYYGLAGKPGPAGPPGLQGPSGRDGAMGPKGEKGDRGNTPEIDLSKLKGDKGDIGLTGNPGYPGPVGLQGPPGICVSPLGSPEQYTRGPFSPSAATDATSFLPSTTQDVKYTLLHPTNGSSRINDSYSPGLWSYEFTSGEPAEVDPRATNLVGVNLSPPFIVTAIFKSFTDNSSCLFSIKQDDHSVMSLCLTSAANMSRVTLFTELYSPPNSLSYLFNETFKDKWIKIVMYVNEDDEADVYVNCEKLKSVEKLPTLKKNKDILLTKDMELTLANKPLIGLTFEGLIEEISLFTNASDDTLMLVCKENSNISSYYEKHGQTKKNPRQSIEYDFKKDLAECHREITVIKEGMNDQIENITRLIRNEVREDIEYLQTMVEYLKEELKFIQNKNIDNDIELKELKSQIQVLTTVQSNHTLSENAIHTSELEERSNSSSSEQN